MVSTLCSRSIHTREGIIIKALDCAAAAANRDALAKTVYARLFDWYFLLQYYISHVMPYFKGLIILPHDSWPIPRPRKQPTSPAFSGRRIDRANGPDLAFSGHFAQKYSNFLGIQPAVHSPLSKSFSNKPLKFSEINPQSTTPPAGRHRAPHDRPPPVRAAAGHAPLGLARRRPDLNGERENERERNGESGGAQASTAPRAALSRGKAMEDPFGDASGSDRRTRTRGTEVVVRSAALERLRAIRDGSARAAAVVQVKVDAQIYARACKGFVICALWEINQCSVLSKELSHDLVSI